MHVLACQVDAPGNSYQLSIGRLLHDRGIPGFSRTFPWPGRGLGPRGQVPGPPGPGPGGLPRRAALARSDFSGFAPPDINLRIHKFRYLRKVTMP